jgi:DNA-binding NarL/FixJ family response regulator
MDNTTSAKRILLIDDDPVVSRLLAFRIMRACESAQVDVEHNPSVRPGYDFYVIDNDFGGKQEGVRLAESLSLANPDAKVLVLSSFLDAKLLKRAVNARCHGAFDKRDPDDVSRLIRMICEAPVGRTSNSPASPRRFSLLREIASLIGQWNRRMRSEERKRKSAS